MPTEKYSDVLIQEATPEIYRTNAFRLMELPVDTTPREFARREHELQLAENIGVSLPPGPARFLPLSNQVDLFILSEAAQRIHDPERRLIDEFFWFWPHRLGQSKQDEALSLLAEGDAKKAERIWLQQEQVGDAADISTHNLAVLSHVTALDLENSNSTNGITTEEQEALDNAWVDVYNRWGVLIESEGFWSLLTARIRELDDPRLTTGSTRRIRAALPAILLSINANLAIGAARSGDRNEAKRQVQIMQQSGFSASLVTDALHKKLKGIRSQISVMCETTRESAEQNPEQADDAAVGLLRDTAALMLAVDYVLPGDNVARMGIHDEVVNRAMVAAVTYGNKTEDWQRSLELLEEIQKIAASPQVNKRILVNRRTVQRNIEAEERARQLAMCWYCEEKPGDEGSAMAVKMYGEVRRKFNQLQWKTATAQVPRCNECMESHEGSEGKGCLASFAFVVLGLALAYALADSFWPGFFIFAVVVGIGVFVGNRVSNRALGGIREASDYQENPIIIGLQSEGWKIGEKPPEANG